MTKRWTKLLLRLLSSAPLLGLALEGMPSTAFGQEEPYDYYHASSCFNYTVADPVDRRHLVPGGSANSALGSVDNVSDKGGGFLVCPITRIYPRTPGRLTQVIVDLWRSDYDPPGGLPVYAYAQVCIKYADDESEALCVADSAYDKLRGKTTIIFDTAELASIRDEPFGWNQYMYIAVAQLPGDKLYGYRTVFNLQ